MADLEALIVEDDEDLRASVAALIAREGYTTSEAGNLQAARAAIAGKRPDVVLVDLRLPDGDGFTLLGDTEVEPRPEFIVMTGHAAVETAVEALRAGALDYLPKPVDRSRLKSVLANVARTLELRGEVTALRAELRELGRFGPMIGRSPVMQDVYDLIGRVAPTDASVFVVGESGTGKELVAETIQRLSRRRSQPFLALNCGAMSPTLIESELFGHEKGAFTGADRRKRGYFEEADGGTLFLDEITEMPVELQVNLLRVLETGTVTRIGATQAVPIDVRVLAASNRDPAAAVADGTLREDLLYRLNVFPIELPPLRERGDDVTLLAQAFLDDYNRRESAAKRFSDASLDHLSRLPWPGNVRELKNVVERAAILTDSVIEADKLPPADPMAAPAAPGSRPKLQVEVGSSIADVERRLILATLEALDGDKKRAAKVLGISLKTLYNRLKVYEAEAGARRDRRRTAGGGALSASG